MPVSLVLASETMVESIRLVSHRHVNPLSTLHGGYMLQWLVDTGTVAAMRFAESDVVLGFFDKTHFVEPVQLGDIIIFKAWILNVRRTSMGVLVESYVHKHGELKLATISRQVYVKIANGVPSPLGKSAECDRGWEGLCEYFKKWRNDVDLAIGEREMRKGWRTVSSFLVMPEDSLDGFLMYGGRLLFKLDELTFIEAYNFYPTVYVTASVNAIAFRKPIYVGDIVEVKTGVTYVGRTSIEVGFIVEAYGFRGRRRVADGYFTFVNMAGGAPSEIKAEPRGDAEALKRKQENVAEARALRRLRPIPGKTPWLLQLFQ